MTNIINNDINPPQNSNFNSTTSTNTNTYPKYYMLDLNLMREKNCHNILVNHSIQPFFDNLEEILTHFIQSFPYVIGCVAWLTNPNIIKVLETRDGVKIIVNKEEYLSTNMRISRKKYYQNIHIQYNKLMDFFSIKCLCCQKYQYQCPKFQKIFGQIENKDGSVITCGIVNNLSKMHHKFLIFLDENLEPKAMWTGSYNLSKTSNFSLENALYITDTLIIAEYIKEFLAVYAYSEPFDWKSGLLFAPVKKS